MFQLKRFLRPYLKQTIIGSVAKLVEAILELLLPLLMARIIDVGIHNMDIPYIWKTGILMLGVIIVGLGSATLCQYFASVTCQNVGNDIRRELIQKISQLSYQELDQFGNTTLINRLTNDVNQVVMAVAYLIRLVSRAPFLCVGALVMSIYIDPQLSLVFVVLIPIFVLVLVVIMKKTVPLYQNAQRKLDRLGQVLRENLSGVRVIRAFARHEKERERMDEATEQLARANIHVTNLSALMNPITSVVMNAGSIVLLYFGGISVNAGNLTQGSIVALINYVTQILMALIIVANLVVLFTKASASANRINEVLTCDVSVKDQQAERELDPTAPFVEFDHVSFGYNQKEVLEDISFTLPVGNILGVVGTTGSGKSTLINLIPRFYDVNQGEVRFGGKPVKQLAQDYLRSKITIVPQKTVLFSGSIADNIRWGKEDATEQEIIDALKAAQAYDFVKTLNKGIHSQIHEGGKNFSGGQQQRLSIARALVRKPDLLILDDSLSALDYQTDLKLRRSLKEYLKNGTIIIVSQRISSVTLADHILVLDDGKLVGHGKHEELLQTCETYQEIYQSQSK